MKICCFLSPLKFADAIDDMARRDDSRNDDAARPCGEGDAGDLAIMTRSPPAKAGVRCQCVGGVRHALRRCLLVQW